MDQLKFQESSPELISTHCYIGGRISQHKMPSNDNLECIAVTEKTLANRH